MKARHQVSRNAVTLIKRFEGYRATAAQLSNGRWTIGYGHTLTAREGASVSLQDAEALLLYDLIAVAHAINEHSYTPLNQNQFDALASFAFNIGVENFRHSAVLRRINEGALIQAACSMEMWRKADLAGDRIVIDALVRRRSAEKNLFLTPPEGWIAAPSPVLPPKVDYDASYAVPRQAPAPVTAPLDGDRAEARLDTAAPLLPVPPDDDEQPTLSERAAAAVGARLESILPDETSVDIPLEFPARAIEPPVEAPAVADTAPLAAAAAATPSVAKLETAASSPPAPLPRAPAPLFETPPPEPAASAESAAGQPSWGARLADEPPVVSSFDPAFALEERPNGRGLVPMLVLALFGLALFAVGVFLAASAGPDAPVAGRGLGWLMGVIGVTCFGAAAYLLLRRLDNGHEA